jgi:MarR family transcriptional regulator, transcriptional regulator for hemolysin
MAPTVSSATPRRAATPRWATRSNLGFLLAKASQHWNELLYERFVERGWAEVRPAYGSILLPLFEEDALRMGELASRAGLAKQTMTTMVRLLERDGLVSREPDPGDGRAMRIRLTPKAQRLRSVAEEVLGELDHLMTLSLGDRRSENLATDLEEVIAL